MPPVAPSTSDSGSVRVHPTTVITSVATPTPTNPPTAIASLPSNPTAAVHVLPIFPLAAVLAIGITVFVLVIAVLLLLRKLLKVRYLCFA